MCGIVGYYSLRANQKYPQYLAQATASLNKRGPDAQQTLQLSEKAGFGHARLSIIDTSSIANQPMTDSSGRYTIIFNGEIFNYQELRDEHLVGLSMQTHSDTEVLLYLFIKLKKDCLHLLNGFFVFAVYDKETDEVFLARDRFGIKPLHIYHQSDEIIFASELKAILQFPVIKEIDRQSLHLYLQLNYLPGNCSMLRHVHKLLPGHSAIINKEGNLFIERYYQTPYIPSEKINAAGFDYEKSKKQLRALVENSVNKRLVSDVPLGTFLSGGIDSSIVTFCASRQVSDLNTFSIGFKDEPYFDETRYANLVASRYRTKHTVFAVSNDDMCSHIYEVLDYIDEPFADSSAIAVYILSYYTRKKVTVALSGDGGDELFAGYNKHKAEVMARVHTLFNTLLKAGHPVFKMLPQSRHANWMNRLRQLARFSEGLHLSPSERYWRWCAFQTSQEAQSLLAGNFQSKQVPHEAIEKLIGFIREEGDLNDVLFADLQMVLPGDMLTKVDSMSMANSLEVRVPLLDHHIVDFAFSLPVDFKINGGVGKRILKEAFADALPAKLMSRPKHGFEVPLLKWLRNDLRNLVEEQLLNDTFIREQQIFNPKAIRLLKEKLFSKNPGDAHAIIWSLVVFQYWYKKYIAV